MSDNEIAELKEKHIAELEKKLDEAKYIINELLDFDFLPEVEIKKQAEQFVKEDKIYER